jgi:hypothetical protein
LTKLNEHLDVKVGILFTIEGRMLHHANC